MVDQLTHIQVADLIKRVSTILLSTSPRVETEGEGAPPK